VVGGWFSKVLLEKKIIFINKKENLLYMHRKSSQNRPPTNLPPTAQLLMQKPSIKSLRKIVGVAWYMVHVSKDRSFESLYLNIMKNMGIFISQIPLKLRQVFLKEAT
jgi:hypothetical protein